jgi:hypothetical protein
MEQARCTTNGVAVAAECYPSSLREGLRDCDGLIRYRPQSIQPSLQMEVRQGVIGRHVSSS